LNGRIGIKLSTVNADGDHHKGSQYHQAQKGLFWRCSGFNYLIHAILCSSHRSNAELVEAKKKDQWLKRLPVPNDCCGNLEGIKQAIF
jgi:hypothetical protein